MDQQAETLSTQAQITNVYNHIFNSLQQGKQPGSNKDISAATRLSPQSLRTAIHSLCDTGHLRRWKSRPDDKFSPMHYEIPGEDFPETQAKGSAVEGNRLRAEAAEGRKNDKTAMDLMRSLHEQGYTIPEIVQLVANHIDDTLFAETSIAYVLNNTRPNYSHMLKLA